MDKNHFDVVIFGAGIGGSLCASRLSQKKLKVLLVERNPNIPTSKDTLVTQYKYMKKFNLDASDALNRGSILSYSVYPEMEKSSFTSKQIGIDDPLVLNCNTFIKRNITDAMKKGCIFKINDELGSIKKIEGIYHIKLQNEDFPFTAKIVVDSTGTNCAVGKMLNIFKQRYPVGYCYTFLTSGDNIKNRTEAFFEVERFSRWFWIYPISHKKSFVGLYVFRQEKPEQYIKDINKYLKMHGHEYDKHYNLEAGVSFLNMFSPIKSKKIVHDSVLFLGESGGTTTPLLGEGFRPMAEIIIWLEENIVDILSDKKQLSELDNHFFSTVAKDYPLMRAVLPFLLKMSHKESKEIMTNHILKMNPKALYNFTIVKQDTNQWKKIVHNVMQTLSLRKKLILGLSNPLRTLKLISILKEKKIIKSPFDLI